MNSFSVLRQRHLPAFCLVSFSFPILIQVFDFNRIYCYIWCEVGIGFFFPPINTSVFPVPSVEYSMWLFVIHHMLSSHKTVASYVIAVLFHRFFTSAVLLQLCTLHCGFVTCLYISRWDEFRIFMRVRKSGFYVNYPKMLVLAQDFTYQNTMLANPSLSRGLSWPVAASRQIPLKAPRVSLTPCLWVCSAGEE